MVPLFHRSYRFSTSYIVCKTLVLWKKIGPVVKGFMPVDKTKTNLVLRPLIYGHTCVPKHSGAQAQGPTLHLFFKRLN